MAKNSLLATVFLPFCLAIPAAHSQNLSAPLGKQRAAGSPLEWEIREAGHPILGNIRFAVLKKPLETSAGSAKVYSSVYVSCEKANGKLAIELTNTTAPADPGGLQRSTMPRLVCSRPVAPGDDKLVQEDLFANWGVSNIGDALTRGFRPFPLRECVSIRVVQDVVLPAGSAQKSAHVEFDILPYDRALDSIFVTCGDVSAYAPGASPATAVTARPASAPAAVAPSKPAPEADATWQTAHTLSSGRTRVRAGPTLKSAVVAELFPGAAVLVQRTDSEWWRVKSPSRAKFEGYIRQDRLIFK